MSKKKQVAAQLTSFDKVFENKVSRLILTPIISNQYCEQYVFSYLLEWLKFFCISLKPNLGIFIDYFE